MAHSTRCFLLSLLAPFVFWSSAGFVAAQTVELADNSRVARVTDLFDFGSDNVLLAAPVGDPNTNLVLTGTNGSWNADVSDVWSNAADWLGGNIADGASATGNFTFNITAARIITIDGLVASRTLGILNIGDSDTTASYTIAASGGGTLTFDNGGSAAQLNMTSTSFGDSISAPILLKGNLNITDAAATAGLSLSGTIQSSAVSGTQTISFLSGSETVSGVISNGATGGTIALVEDVGAGSLTLSGTNTYTGGTTIKSGTLSFNNTAALGTTGTVTLGVSGGTLDASLIWKSSGKTTTTISRAITVASGDTGTLTLGSSGGNGLITFSGAITLNGNLTLTSNNAGLTLSGVISGGGGLIIDSGRVFTLSNTNTYTGGTTVSSGTVKITDISNLGTGSLTLGGQDPILFTISTGTLNWAKASGAGQIYNKTINIPGNATIDTTGAGATTGLTISGTLNFTDPNFIGLGNTLTLAGGSTGNVVSSVISDNSNGGPTTVVVNATGGSGKTSTSGAWTLSGVNTYTGGTFINGGTLGVANAAALGASSSLIDFGGGILQYVGITTDFSSRFDPFPLSAQQYKIDTNGQNVTFATALTDAGGFSASLTKLGAGILTLTKVASYTGTTTVNGGTLRAGIANAFPDKPVVVSGTGAGVIATLDLNNLNDTIFSLTLGGSTTTSGASVTTGTGTLTLDGDGVATDVTYNATNNPLGATISGKLSLGSSGSSLTTNRIFNIGDSTSTAADLTISAVISGSGMSLTKTGAGTLVLSGANTYSGGTNINGGILNLAVAQVGTTSGPMGGTGTISFGGGTLQYSATNTTDYSPRFSTATNQQYKIDTNGQNVTFASALTSGTDVNGSGSLTKLGAGTLTLSAANTYTGSTTVNNGTLKLGINSALPSTTALTLSGTGAAITATLDLNGFNTTIASLALGGSTATSGASIIGTGTLTLGGDVTYSATNNPLGATISSSSNLNLGSATRTFTIGDSSNAIADLTISSVISNGGLTKAGAGTLVLSGANTYTGGTNINGGILNLASSGALGTTGTIEFGGGILQYTASNTTDYSARFDNVDINQQYKIDTNGQSITFASGLSSSGGTLTKLGSGTLTLSAVNSYTGGTTVNGGTLLAGVNGALPSGAPVIVSGLGAGITATLNLNGFNNTFTSLTLGGSTTTSGAAILTGAGILTLAGDVTYDATNNPLGATISGNLDLGGATRTFNVGDSTTAANDLTIFANISGTGGLTKAGAGTLLLSGTNTYNGATTINNGTLKLGAASGLPSNSAVIVSSSGSSTATLDLNGFSTTIASLTFGGATTTSADVVMTGAAGTLTLGGDVTYDATNNPLGALITGNLNLGSATRTFNIGDSTSTNAELTISAVISGSVGLIKTGAGALILSGANTYTGPTTISTGTLQFPLEVSLYNDDTSKWTADNLIVNSGATAAFNVGGTGEFTSADIDILKALGTNTGGFLSGSFLGLDTTNAGGNFTYGSNITDTNGGNNALGITKLGTGTLTLTGTNTYTGGTNINGGTLALGSLDAIGSTGTISFGGGTLQYSATNTTDYSPRFSTAPNQLYSIDTNSQNITFATALTSSGGSLTKTGAGTLLLPAANTYSGGTILNGGLLQVSGVGTLGDSSGPLTINAGTLDLNGTTQTVGGLGGIGGTIVNDATGTNVTFTIGFGDGGGTYAGVIADNSSGTGTIALVKTGAGTEILSGPNTYTGGTTINGGNLQVAGAENPGVSGPLGTSGIISFGGGAIQYSAANTFDYSSRFSTDPNQPYSVNTNGQSVTWATPLTSSGGSLTKSGSGTLSLTAANTYDGPTTVNAGTLSIASTGSLTSAITVNAGTLSGNGSTTGAVTIGNGAGVKDAFIAPGGTFTTTSTLSIANDGVFSFTLNASNLSNDTIVANGISLASGSFIDINIQGGGPNAVIPIGTTFLLLNNTSIAPITGTFSDLADNQMVIFGLNTYQASYEGGDGNDLILTVVVPEPSTWAMFAFGTVLLFAVQRFRWARR